MQVLKEQQQDFNEEPVEYCKHCLSLAIRDVNNQPYCDKCGSTNVDSTDIFTWEQLYVNMYGTKFINKNEENGREQRS